jgi:hypothetical protein
MSLHSFFHTRCLIILIFYLLGSLLFFQIHLHALPPLPKFNYFLRDVRRTQDLVPRIHNALHIDQPAVHACLTECAVQRHDVCPLRAFHERE